MPARKEFTPEFKVSAPAMARPSAPPGSVEELRAQNAALRNGFTLKQRSRTLRRVPDPCRVGAHERPASPLRGGHRQANAALYRSTIVRMRFHQPTIDYVARRTAEGMPKREIIRCVKRYLAREIYQRVMTDHRARQAIEQAA